MFRKRQPKCAPARYFPNFIEVRKQEIVNGIPSEFLSVDTSDYNLGKLPKPETFSLRACIDSGKNLNPVNPSVLPPLESDFAEAALDKILFSDIDSETTQNS